MRKLFTFLFAALMSVGMFATTVVTITDSDFPAWGDSFTKDGVTVSAVEIDGMYGDISGPGSFSTTLGNFTKIEIFAEDVSTISGEGWSGGGSQKIWTGNASSVSFTGSINGYEEGTTLKFTIEEPAPQPQPAGIGPREEFNLGTSSYAGEHYQVLGEFSGSSWIGVGGNDNKTITVESLNGEIIDNITLKVYFPSSWTGYSIASTSGTVSGDVANYQDLVVTNINATSVTLSRVGEGNANGSVSFHRIIVNEGSTTAIENTAVDTKAVKRIVNGMLLIEKNGKIYNVMGAEVK